MSDQWMRRFAVALAMALWAAGESGDVLVAQSGHIRPARSQSGRTVPPPYRPEAARRAILPGHSLDADQSRGMELTAGERDPSTTSNADTLTPAEEPPMYLVPPSAVSAKKSAIEAKSPAITAKQPATLVKRPAAASKPAAPTAKPSGVVAEKTGKPTKVGALRLFGRDAGLKSAPEGLHVEQRGEQSFPAEAALRPSSEKASPFSLRGLYSRFRLRSGEEDTTAEEPTRPLPALGSFDASQAAPSDRSTPVALGAPESELSGATPVPVSHPPSVTQACPSHFRSPLRVEVPEN